MKSTRKYLFAVCALALGFTAPAIHAEDDAPPPPRKERGDRVEMLKEKLGLSDDQVTQIKKIFAEEKDAIKALRDKDLEPKARRAEMEKIRESIKTKMDAVLTAEQKAKFEEMRKNRPKGPGGPDGDKEHKGPPPAEEPAT